MGNEDWINDAVQTVKSSCENQVNTNFSLWEAPDNETVPYPPPAVADNLCPDDCSGHGSCVKGNCNISKYKYCTFIN